MSDGSNSRGARDATLPASAPDSVDEKPAGSLASHEPWWADHKGASGPFAAHPPRAARRPATKARWVSTRERRSFFYVATGDRYRAEAVASAQTLRVHLPHAHVVLFADKEVDGPFDETVILESPTFSFADKVEAFSRVRAEMAVFLDTDTFIAAPIDDLFTLLEHVDFAAAIEVARGFWYDAWNLPDCFPEFNTGVVAFRRTPAVECMFREWRKLFEESRGWQSRHEVSRDKPWDQPSLRKALYDSRDVRIAALPTEYNALRHDGTYLWGRAKIVHGRGNIATVEKRMNRHPNLERVFFQGLGMVAPFDKLPLRGVLEVVARTNAVALRDIFWRLRDWLSGKRKPEIPAHVARTDLPVVAHHASGGDPARAS